MTLRGLLFPKFAGRPANFCCALIQCPMSLTGCTRYMTAQPNRIRIDTESFKSGNVD